jgi:hypothetical protein
LMRAVVRQRILASCPRTILAGLLGGSR